MFHKEKTWQLQDAKAHFSHLVDLAEKGEPITITRRGHEVAVLISKKQYAKLTKKKHGLFNCLINSPYPELDFDITRFKEPPREIEL